MRLITMEIIVTKVIENLVFIFGSINWLSGLDLTLVILVLLGALSMLRKMVGKII